MSIKSILIFFLNIAMTSTLMFAQEGKDMLKELVEENRSAVDAIVLYPEEVRNNIFEAAQQAELLIKLSNLQEKTKNGFQSIIKPYSQEEQASFYELTRYKGLIRDLVGNGKKSKAEINELLEKYPEEIHEIALAVGRKEYEILQKIFQLNVRTKNAFAELIKPYSTKTQSAIKALVETPEVLTILTDNLDLTILVGDAYQNEPEWLQAKAKELNLVVASQQAQELEDYKKQLEQDPEAYQEMLEASELYKKDNKIEETAPKSESTVRVVYSYPYWYGYPYWYASPYWTPVPYYYHTGFYIGPGGTVVIIGLPSFHYVHWHYTYYPHMHVHLHAHYHRHYRRHPHSHTGFHAAVNVNVNKNINIRNNSRTMDRSRLPSKGDQGNPKLELGKNRGSDRNFDRFKANDNHRGNWGSKRQASQGKLAQGRRN